MVKMLEAIEEYDEALKNRANKTVLIIVYL